MGGVVFSISNLPKMAAHVTRMSSSRRELARE
jgi:hypothetical protein